MRLAVVESRSNDRASIKRRVGLSPSDARRIAPTIGKTQPIPTRDIVMKSRFKNEDPLH